MRQELEEVEKNFLLIKGAKQTDRFSNKDKRDFEERLEENKKKNLDLFFSKYPGLKEEQIKNMDQFDRNNKDKMKNINRNPDMSFCNFIISFCMFSLSLITFYSHRDFNNEYFNR